MCFSCAVTSQSVLFSLVFRVLVDTVVHFPPSVEEVTLSVSDERMWVRNHVEEEAGDKTDCYFHAAVNKTNILTSRRICAVNQKLKTFQY